MEMEAVAPGPLINLLRVKCAIAVGESTSCFPPFLHALHFQTFMRGKEFSDELKDKLSKWVSDDNVNSKSFDMISLKYGVYCEDTMSGTCGKTAKFWMIYCHLVDLYLLFHGAMKTCTVDLFTYVLHYMSRIFFTTNNQN